MQSTLDQRADALIGRERERRALLELVERDMPLVAFVHGIAGVGKSTLLQAAAVDARARGTLVAALDGRAFEPTERGFLTSLGDALGTPLPTIADATGAGLQRPVQGREGTWRHAVEPCCLFFRKAHGLHPWWEPDLRFTCRHLIDF